MVQDVAAPVSIIVIALDVVSRPDVPPVVGADFAHFVGLLGSVGAVGTEAGSFSVTVSLEPDYEVTGALNRFAGIIADFEAQSEPNRLRALIHFGTAFRARGAHGAMLYQGSAVRSVGNSLKRSALPAGVFATGDFANYASALKGVLGFEVAKSGADGFCPVVFGERRKPSTTTEIHSTDPQLVEWLKARLARDLGPFAAALVDNASHSTRTAKELAAAVGHEIVSPSVRQKFDADVFKYLRSRGF